MNAYAFLQSGALVGYVFVLGLLYGRARQNPVNRAFRVFLLFALGWALTGFFAALPQAAGYEMLIKRAGAVCWISINFWFLRFIYLLLKRPRDFAYWLLAACVAVGTATYVFTSLAVQGFVRYDWGVAVVRGPLHAAISLIPAISGGYALLVLARAIPATRHLGARKSLALLLVGGTVALTFAMATNAVLPVVFGWKGFPELGSLGVLVICPFLYRAVTRHDFLSLTVADAADRLFEDLPDGIMIVDPSGHVAKMNTSAKAMLGHFSTEDDRLSVSQVLPDRLGADVGEIRLSRGAGERHIAVMRSRNTRDGVDLGEVILLRDVTEQKRTEELLRKSRDELQAEVVRQTEELRHAQKMEAIGTLAGGIAHDFNNILAALVGFATAAKEDLPDGNPLHSDLAEVLRAASRARDIVKQLLSFARRKEPQKKPVNVADVVAESIKLLEASLPSTIHVDFVPSRKQSVVVADPTQLQQVVLNLATNAYHAMDDRGGVLRLSLSRLPVDSVFAEQHPPLKPGPHVCLAVSDSGCGMPPEILEQIFDPFFTTKTADQGTGLGLATALRIAHEHGGTITAESEPSVGSTFRVYLPIAEFDLLADSTKDTHAPTGTDSILIVDDKEPVAAATARLLQPLGYKVTVFTDPELAISAVTENPNRFDLVITDQTMPRVTGVVLAERMAKVRADLPVLLVSGYPPPAALTLETRPLRAFLAKPLEKGALARTIRKLIDASHAHASTKQGRQSDPDEPDLSQRPN